MASWKKVVVSGSAAELNSLTLVGSAGSITNASTVAATKLTGSFTGSFIGDGSQLTGLPSTDSKYLVYQTGSGANSIQGITDGTNDASGVSSVVGGGVSNQATGACSTIGGGKSNITTNSGGYGTVGGGTQNEALGQWAPTVAGGFNNCVNNSYGSILGGLTTLLQEAKQL